MASVSFARSVGVGRLARNVAPASAFPEDILWNIIHHVNTTRRESPSRSSSRTSYYYCWRSTSLSRHLQSAFEPIMKATDASPGWSGKPRGAGRELALTCHSKEGVEMGEAFWCLIWSGQNAWLGHVLNETPIRRNSIHCV